MDLERASNIIKAFPHISKTIVDDTLYEKVLSYLTLVISTVDISKLNDKCQIFQSIHKACLEIPDQDYRVTTLCIRFMGQVIFFGKTDMFKQLQDHYPKLLLLVTSGIRSSEGALRCACIEACKLFIHCPEGYAWLLNNKQATSFITFALLDQSNYVVAEACQLFSTLLKLNAHSLLEAMDPSSLILSILHPDCDEKQIISALDFCWEIVNVKEQTALDYIREKKLLHPVMQLLCSTNRIIRSRVLEIISILFAWDTDPLNSLDLKDTTTANTIDLAYQKFSFISNTMIAQAIKMEDLMTGVSLLDTSLILLQRSSIQNQLPLNILFSLFDSCVSDKPNEEYRNIKRLLVTNRNKNNLMQAILKIMDKLISFYPRIITEDPRFVQVFDILDNSLFYSDGRVLKSCLTLLSTSLQHYEQPELLNKSIHSLINMLEQSDFKNLVIILESFDHLVGHDKIGTLLTEFSVCQTFVNELNNKLFDTEWNIRDVVINFVGNLFKEPYNKTRIKFGLNFDLPLQVFDRIQDTEPYVRASALQVLSSMIKHDEGWCYIQRHEQSKTLLKKLPSLLHDSEAFVRRAGLDTIICLAQYRSYQGINMEMEQSEDSLSPFLIKKLIQDQDSDVRIRACTLIEKLWIIYSQKKMNVKKQKMDENKAPELINTNEFNKFFESIRADELLVECGTDITRVVRIEAYRVISTILNQYQPTVTETSKRLYEQDDQFITQFLNTLSGLDMVRLKDSLDPEHLYEEAFDINADMMTQSIVPNDPDDDMNMLDCY